MFSWLEAFKTIGNYIEQYEHDQKHLIGLLKEVGVENNFEDELASGEKIPLAVIDPFTFFCFFMKYKDEKRVGLIANLLSKIDQNIMAPEDFLGVPTAPAQKLWLFPFAKSRTDEMVALLWLLFKETKSGEVSETTFDKALAIPGVGFIKATQCLFYVDPVRYFPVNAQTVPFLENNNIKVPEKNWRSYMATLNQVSEQFKQPFYELSYLAWQQNQFSVASAMALLNKRNLKLKLNTSKIVCYETAKGKELALSHTKKQVEILLTEMPDEGAYKVKTKKNNQDLKETMTLAEQHYGVVVKSEAQLNNLCDWYEDSMANTPEDEKGASEQKMNKKTKQPLNQILFGPPGVGKTFCTRAIAVHIAEAEWYESLNLVVESRKWHEAIQEKYDELKDEQRIVFTTFHQSFSYEDFVEGIRARTDAETNTIHYDIVDGVFKKLCINAEVKELNGTQNWHGDIVEQRVWKMSLGNTQYGAEGYVYDECLEKNYVLLGYGADIDFSGCDTWQTVSERAKQASEYDMTPYGIDAVHRFKNEMAVGDLIVVSDGNSRFRAIAEITGDYEFLAQKDRSHFRQSREVAWLKHYQPSLPVERILKKLLSQQTLYELKGTTLDREKLKALLAADRIDKPQDKQESKPHVLIIDEINRGNISKIFGELITLLEPTKRQGEDDAQSAMLPCSQSDFSVPNNVYIVGTMNTADKSLAQLDVALRRRFEFVELLPNPDLLKGIMVYGVELSALLDIINARIEVLLDREHMIGHSFFMPIISDKLDQQEKEVCLGNVFKNNILPLLQEYFFEDYEKIALVLNDTTKKEECRFIQDQNTKSLRSLDSLFPSEWLDQLFDRRYRINTEAFFKPEAYKGIL